MGMNIVNRLKLSIALNSKAKQWEVADKLSINESRFSKILNGRIAPSKLELDKIASYLRQIKSER